MFGYNAVMYRNDEVHAWNSQLIPIQRTKKTFVTVREAADIWGCGVGTAFARLKAGVRRGMVERVGSHYHVKGE